MEQNKTIFELKDNLVEFYLQRLEMDTDFIQAMQGLSGTPTSSQSSAVSCLAEKLFSEIRSDFMKQTDFCYELGAQTPNRIIGFTNVIVEEFLEMGLMWMMSAKHVKLQAIAVRDSDISAIHRQVMALSEEDSHVPVFEEEEKA